MTADYDVIVIGAGVSGALIAWQLPESGGRVLILDSGTKQMDPSDREKFVTAFAQASQVNKTPSQPYQPTANRAGKVMTSPDIVDFKLIGQTGATPYFIQIGPDVWLTCQGRSKTRPLGRRGNRPVH